MLINQRSVRAIINHFLCKLLSCDPGWVCEDADVIYFPKCIHLPLKPAPSEWKSHGKQLSDDGGKQLSDDPDDRGQKTAPIPLLPLSLLTHFQELAGWIWSGDPDREQSMTQSVARWSIYGWRGVPQELTNPKWNAHHGTDGGPAQLLSTVTFKNWSRVDLQCCFSSWCTAKWFNYIYIYIFFSDYFPL